LLVWN